MDTNINRLFFAALRSGICGTELSREHRDACSPEAVSEMLALAKRHDVQHLIAAGLKQSGLAVGEAEVEKSLMSAIFRYEQNKREYKRICEALEAEQIPFMPLKGAVMRRYYKTPWMRTSCDIDVLVHEESADGIAEMLISKYGYTHIEKGSHDIALMTQSKLRIELHYGLVEEGLVRSAHEVLSTAWEQARLVDGRSFHYEMPDEMFYFYHIAHMAKHFEGGGCGIRPFIDLWILDGLDADAEGREALLRQGGLARFASACRELVAVWIGGAEHSELTLQMERFILGGGAYGTTENRIAVQQRKRGGKFGYLMSKVFLPYDVIKFHYPVLHKHRWLTPLMQVVRWFKLLFCGGVKRSVNEVKYNAGITASEAEQTERFLESIGLE